MRADQESILNRYAEAVSNSPTFLGLTSQADRTEFFERHVSDAVALLEALQLPEEARALIDVGTGNGVPGLVWAVLRPQWSVTLLDSDSKKCGFLESFLISNEIANAKVRYSRAESEARGLCRETFDIAVSRAVGPLSTSLELLSGFVRIGGLAIVSRGTSELLPLTSVGDSLALSLAREVHYAASAHVYAAAVFAKTAALDPQFPRPVGRPAKRPL